MGTSAPKFRTALATTLALSMAIPPSFAQAVENANALSTGGSMEALDVSGVPHAQDEAMEESVAAAGDVAGAPADGGSAVSADAAGGVPGAPADGGAADDGNAGEAVPEAGGPPLASTSEDSAGRTEAVVAPVEGDIAIDEANFPDPAFRAWLSSAENLKGIGSDGVLSRREREAVQIIVIKRQGIHSIKGIELFPNLTMIDFEGNYIEEVDLSGNPELRTIYLRSNLLESVDFTHNTKLEFIEVFDNRLSEVDLSMLPNLRFAHLDWNDLKVIDISHNTKLEDDGFVGNNNPLEKVVLPKIEGRSFDTFVISELDGYEGHTSTLPEWYTTPDFQEGTGFVPSTIAEREYQPFDGQTLYAKRTPNAYTINFDPNGGTGSMDAVDRAWNDGLAPLPENTFKRFGYRFRGWSLDGKATDPTYLDGQEVENISGGKDTGMKVTLYAVWEPIEESSGYFRSQLSQPLQTIYDDLASQLDELIDPADPSSVRVQVPEGEERYLQKVLFAVLRDHPEYFWVDFSKLAWSEVAPDSATREGSEGEPRATAPAMSEYELDMWDSNDASYFVDGFDADNLASYRSRFDAKVAEVVAGAPGDTVSAVRYFNAWLADNNVYNPSGLGASNFSRTAASGILSANDPSSGPVCYGYATAMKVLLDRAGIENAYIEGFARNGENGGGEQHAWNAVSIDGKWYAIDPTWNDPTLSSAAPLETYLLVGSDTVTSLSLKGFERFGRNHDAAKSPASTYGLSYPALAANAAPAVANGPIEVIGDGWSTRYDSLAKGIVAAREGDVVKLWGDASAALGFKVERKLSIDLNGNAVAASHGAAFSVLPGGELHLANSAQKRAEVSSGLESAIENEGSLEVDANIKLAAAGSNPAVSGVEPGFGDHAYVRTSSSGEVVEVFAVSEPIAPQRGEADISDIGDSSESLVSFVNNAGAPALEVRYVTADGSERDIPRADVPAYEWKLVSGPDAPGGTAGLQAGMYAFEATVFGYPVRYELEVADAELDQIIEDGLREAEAMVRELHEQEAAGLVTSYDAAAADKLLADARAELAGASFKDEAREAVDALLSALGSTPTVADRAGALADSWKGSHAEILGALTADSVDLANARDREVKADDALNDASDDALRTALPDGMGDADKELIVPAVRGLIGSQVDGMRDLLAAASWAHGASEVLAGLTKPVTGAEVEVLESLLASFDELDGTSRSFVADGDIGMIRELLEEARADAENPGGGESGGGSNPGEGGGSNPGGNPGPNPGPGDGDAQGGGSKPGSGAGSGPQSGNQNGLTGGNGGASGGAATGLHGSQPNDATGNGTTASVRVDDSTANLNGGTAENPSSSVQAFVNDDGPADGVSATSARFVDVLDERDGGLAWDIRVVPGLFAVLVLAAAGVMAGRRRGASKRD